jgi:hypothetical protein
MRIASVKRLRRAPQSSADRNATDSGAGTTGTLGAVFAFSSDSTLDTLADNVLELNAATPSHLWPDMVVVLDRGVLAYAIQWPGKNRMAGSLLTAGPVPGQKFGAPPWFVHLMLHSDDTKALNRFFLLLLTQLTFYPLRSGIPPFKRMLGADETTAMAIKGYQYDMQLALKPAPSDLYLENHPTVRHQIEVSGPNGDPLAVLQYIPWQGGASVRKYGRMPLQGILLMVKPGSSILALAESPIGGVELSTVFELSEAEFRAWPALIEGKSNLKASVVDAA